MLRTLLCDCYHERMVAHFDAAQYAVAGQTVEQQIDVAVIINTELIEEFPRVGRLEMTGGNKALIEVMCAAIGTAGYFLEPLFPHDRHVDGYP